MLKYLLINNTTCQFYFNNILIQIIYYLIIIQQQYPLQVSLFHPCSSIHSLITQYSQAHFYKVIIHFSQPSKQFLASPNNPKEPLLQIFPIIKFHKQIDLHLCHKPLIFPLIYLLVQQITLEPCMLEFHQIINNLNLILTKINQIKILHISLLNQNHTISLSILIIKYCVI
ncbi:unnamed protein product [Paramecium primaurelia]|uniref:Uncharacterized protein n=1 Tax=Paramecium primaurelia TaxID=5886 RepID=A0A8S1MCK6_PARPR|nr:unnamed protein product [Paramecium primaurelia]